MIVVNCLSVPYYGAPAGGDCPAGLRWCMSLGRHIRGWAGVRVVTPVTRDVTMDDTDVLTAAFEEHRAHLRGVAYRLLGSMSDADDAVQEAWLRLTSADTSEVENLGGWLTTVVARAALNTLPPRRRRPEETMRRDWPAAIDAAVPEDEAVLADSVGLALI